MIILECVTFALILLKGAQSGTPKFLLAKLGFSFSMLQPPNLHESQNIQMAVLDQLLKDEFFNGGRFGDVFPTCWAFLVLANNVVFVSLRAESMVEYQVRLRPFHNVQLDVSLY